MSQAKPEKWFAVSAAVPPEYTDAAETALDEFDPLGIETDLLSKRSDGLRTVTGYFSEAPDEQTVRAAMRTSTLLHGLTELSDLPISISEVEDQDWLAEWKKHWRPVEIGRFIVAAPWHQLDATDRSVIRIEPNMAFGTGTHETTQLCLAAIDARYRAGMSFLDVGTGTGLLAIAAAFIAGGAERFAAVDIDPDAVAIARENAAANGVGGRIDFYTGSLDSLAGNFDFVCANLTADVIVPMLPDLLRRAERSLVLSGILAEQEEMVLQELPLKTVFEVSHDGEWIAVTIDKARAGE